VLASQVSAIHHAIALGSCRKRPSYSRLSISVLFMNPKAEASRPIYRDQMHVCSHHVSWPPLVDHACDVCGGVAFKYRGIPRVARCHGNGHMLRRCREASARTDRMSYVVAYRPVVATRRHSSYRPCDRDNWQPTTRCRARWAVKASPCQRALCALSTSTHSALSATSSARWSESSAVSMVSATSAGESRASQQCATSPLVLSRGAPVPRL
jgi:hypothetical protein